MREGRLTKLAERRAHSRVMTPVIIEAQPGRLQEVVAFIRDIGIRELVRGFLGFPKLLQEYVPFGVMPLRVIRRFNMVAAFLPREVIFDLAEDEYVRRIYSDEVMWAFGAQGGYPTVPPEGVYEVGRKVRRSLVFTSTYWTKKLVGADVANRKGFMGHGVLVAVPDTGASRVHEQIRGVEFKTVLKGQYADLEGHGCLRNAKVYTSFCGAVDLEELWEKVDTEPAKVKDGEFKEFEKPVYTIGLSGLVRVRGVFRTRSEKKVVIDTPLGRIEATPWHSFLVTKPRKSTRPSDSHRRWWAGYDIAWKRADELEPRRSNLEGDWLLCKPYNGESWRLGADPKLAYLGGLVCGDGTIIYQNINAKTGHVYRRKGTRNEITIYDDDLEFLEELRRRYCAGTVAKDKHEDAYVWRICRKDFVARVIPYLKPPANDLEALRAWIAGFFDAEGYVNIRKDSPSGRVKIISTDKELLEELATLLTAVGIPASVVAGGTSKGSRSHHLVIYVPQVFYRFVEPYCVKKKRVLAGCARITKTGASSKKLKYLGSWIAVPVKSVSIVETRGDEYFYDLADSTDRTYLASGVVSHNTWCVACVGGTRAIDDVMSRRVGRTVPVEGMAPECYLLAIKVLGYGIGTGSTSGIIAGLEIALDAGADVISMSLGGPSETETPEEDAFYPVMQRVVDEGVIPVVAAGNEGPAPNTTSSPGCMPQVLTVGAYNPITGELAEFSSRGPCLTSETWIYVVDNKSPCATQKTGFKRIRDVIPGDIVLGYDERTGKIIPTPVLKTYKVPLDGRKVYEIKCKSGFGLRITEDHPVYIYGKGWVLVSEVKLGDKLLLSIPHARKSFGWNLPEETKLRMKGRTSPRKGYKFTEKEREAQSERLKRYYQEHPEARERLSKLAKKLGWKPPLQKGKRWRLSEEARKHIREAQKRLASLKSVLYRGKNNPFYGKHHTEETKQKLREYAIKQPVIPVSKQETMLYEALKTYFGDTLKQQYGIFLGRKFACRIDIAIPERKIAIFVDGEYWHNYPYGTERDREVTKALEKKGWKVLRFWAERDVEKRLFECVQKVLAVVDAVPIQVYDSGGALILDEIISIEEIKDADRRYRYVYNLETGTHTYLANGFIVHNCNWGDVKPDCVAPGVNIDSACVGFLDIAGDQVENRYSAISGTSMATPHVAGLVALMREAMYKLIGVRLTVEELKRMLSELGHGKTNDDGWGPITWQMFEHWLATEYGVSI